MQLGMVNSQDARTEVDNRSSHTAFPQLAMREQRLSYKAVQEDHKDTHITHTHTPLPIVFNKNNLRNL